MMLFAEISYIAIVSSPLPWTSFVAHHGAINRDQHNIAEAFVIALQFFFHVYMPQIFTREKYHDCHIVIKVVCTAHIYWFQLLYNVASGFVGRYIDCDIGTVHHSLRTAYC